MKRNIFSFIRLHSVVGAYLNAHTFTVSAGNSNPPKTSSITMASFRINDPQYCVLLDHYQGFLIKNCTKTTALDGTASSPKLLNVCNLIDELPNGNKHIRKSALGLLLQP